jgi:signal transduction histidine kinase
MSLQTKFTFFFSVLIGLLFIVSGLLIYGLVNLVLIDTVDQKLILSANQSIEKIRVDSNNLITERVLLNLFSDEPEYIQLWRASGDLLLSKPFGYLDPLDKVGIQQGKPYIGFSNVQGTNVRVISIPLQTARGPGGILQIGMDITMIDLTKRMLSIILVVLMVVSIIIASISTGIFSRQALLPLVFVTQSAREISETNDLTRRIPLPDASVDDDIVQIVISFNDTLEKLDQLLRNQKRLVADVSHELRTPLTVIKGEIGLVKKMGKIDEESIQSIETEVDRLTRLVGNLLLLTQAESGDLPMDFKLFPLDELVYEVFHHMNTLADDKLSVCLEHLDQINFLGDRDRMKQVMLNLIGNAVQYTKQGGNVCIKLTQIDEKAEFSVEDNGPGIAKEDIEHIFNRFFRGEKSRSRSSHAGFGLGLSISQYIVQQHKGEILVESEKGKGTIFRVILPINNKNG